VSCLEKTNFNSFLGIRIVGSRFIFANEQNVLPLLTLSPSYPQNVFQIFTFSKSPERAFDV
jgi:hypothetical protein